MSIEEEIQKLLKQHRMILVRKRTHQCWKHPDGRTFVMSKTPSDANADAQRLRSLKKFLNIIELKGIPGERRTKFKKRKIEKKFAFVATGISIGRPTLKDQLKSFKENNG